MTVTTYARSDTTSYPQWGFQYDYVMKVAAFVEGLPPKFQLSIAISKRETYQRMSLKPDTHHRVLWQ
ncbi:hypothetical protein INT44_001155 [Umbelopsis vinacea]|uniref:Uncharacterized protein n=1 Tax=Umbelopsis vinacea TaxID=44442 RepID=A0A8H7Q9C5_9FUNG|nr:hypothetical protein INT44_001155 [Umbelopsis vinacea]